jgi:hypothetical protein
MGFVEFLNNKYTKGVMGVLNIAAIIGIFIFMGIEGASKDTQLEFGGKVAIITTFSVILMLSWWGLSTALFAGSPEATTYYMYFMMAFLMALCFIAVSIATMIKQ